MVVFKKLTRKQFGAWKTQFTRSKKPGSSLGEHFMAEHFPGHVDHRLPDLSASEQERIIVDNYVVPKENP